MEREAHCLAEYPLCSTMPLSDADVVEVIEKKIGKKVEVETPSFEAGVEKVLNYLLFGADHSSDVYAGVVPHFRLANNGDLRGDITRDEAE
nr:hypothetical protein CFP56_56912 [Quercus suber]